MKNGGRAAIDTDLFTNIHCSQAHEPRTASPTPGPRTPDIRSEECGKKEGKREGDRCPFLLETSPLCGFCCAVLKKGSCEVRIGFEPWGCIWTPVRQGQVLVVATCNGDLAVRTCGVPDAQDAMGRRPSRSCRWSSRNKIRNIVSEDASGVDPSVIRCPWREQTSRHRAANAI